MKRYLSVLKYHVYIIALIVILIITGIITKGKFAVLTNILAGVIMIYAALMVFFWIVKTPARKNRDENI